MATCSHCGTTILFGGKKKGSFRFCNDKCMNGEEIFIIADKIPLDMVKQKTKELHDGPCPKCEKWNGPVDIHTSHQIWSVLVLTSWSSNSQVSCRECGIKAQTLALISSFFLGWWGFPAGIVGTPVQVIKNIIGIAHRPKTNEPSEELEQTVRLNIAQDIIDQRQTQNSES